jgi:hypothetical protein
MGVRFIRGRPFKPNQTKEINMNNTFNIYTESEMYDRKYSPELAAEAAQIILTEQTGKKQQLNLSPLVGFSSPLVGFRKKVTLQKVNQITDEIIARTKAHWN